MLSLLSAMAAPEAGGAGGAGSMTTTFITFGLIIAIFYFLIIRPQRKRDRETKEMLASIKKGDKVVSIGGIHGTVMVVRESTIVVKVDDNTRLEFSRNAINSIVNKTDAAPPAAKKKAKEADAEQKVAETPAAPKKKKAPAGGAKKGESAPDAEPADNEEK